MTVLPALVVAVSVAPIGPEPVGVKVIGISTVWPVLSTSGNGLDGVPIANWGELDLRPESVSGSVAVSVSVRSEDAPTVVVGNAVVAPLRIGVTGEPKAITWPSRVPTYRRPAPTPGTANFAEVPTGALQRRTGSPSTGIGSYARSSAPSPPAFGAHTTQTSAEPGVVPLDVMTGALEEKPNSSDEVARSESVGLPLPDRPYW